MVARSHNLGAHAKLVAILYLYWISWLYSRKENAGSKRKLNEWNHEVFGKIDTLIQNNLIAGQIVESKLLLDPLAMEKIEAKADFKRLAKMHNVFWKQRATINWVEEHENNTRFFHKYASSKQRGKKISQLNINGALTSDKTIIKEEIVSYYQGLFEEDSFSRPQLDGLTFPSISHEDANKLEIKFTEEEVHMALAELAQEKAPGPDGMPIFVISKSWDLMKHDILLVMDELYYNNSIDWRLKSTFLVLIPKVQDLEFITDFRPISLMSSINKIISKFIATRLKKVLPIIISHQQSAYVEGRQIMDGAIIANECINSSQRFQQAVILCKIDFQKSYNNVARSFFDYVLKRMGFGVKRRL
ncbi:uncharacterized protein LOC113280094 [Papaver somniferum]|uniref:uncharacterized protein LOC113280094 n=1 Tax=Papaver somniferum TaxID=3469 RepID=UPI000E6F4EAB|nr:uncharacterized protein LOC113280094 [Papaver somniferum]